MCPWLIGHMAKPETARLAGEAFTLITGADLDALAALALATGRTSSLARPTILTMRTWNWTRTKA